MILPVFLDLPPMPILTRRWDDPPGQSEGLRILIARYPNFRSSHPKIIFPGRQSAMAPNQCGQSTRKPM
jgi:hypothetical protein